MCLHVTEWECLCLFVWMPKEEMFDVCTTYVTLLVGEGGICVNRAKMEAALRISKECVSIMYINVLLCLPCRFLFSSQPVMCNP